MRHQRLPLLSHEVLLGMTAKKQQAIVLEGELLRWSAGRALWRKVFAMKSSRPRTKKQARNRGGVLRIIVSLRWAKVCPEETVPYRSARRVFTAYVGGFYAL